MIRWRFVGALDRSWLGHLGDRSLRSACDLRASLLKGCRGRTSRGDCRATYAAAFPKKNDRFCGKADGEVCHVERFFGTLRAKLGRLVREGYFFFKHAKDHPNAIHFFVANHHLAVKQSTLN